MAATETYQGSLTVGVQSPRDSRADMVVHVDGLDGARSSLDTAIVSATTGRLVHPDDATLPLRTATARWVRGADDANTAEALVFLTYDKRGSGVATDSTEFSNIANVRVGYESVRWWGKDLSVPATAGTSEAITLHPDPSSGNPEILVPTPRVIQVPIWHIHIPVVLSTSPIDSVDHLAGKVNDGSYTLGGKAFAADTLRFNGLYQAAVKVDTGASVTYEFRVEYSFSFREDGWYESILKLNGSGATATFHADKELKYESASFTTPPT